VAAWERANSLPLGAETVLAFVTGVGTFALAAVVLERIDSAVVAAFLGVACLIAVIAIARFVSVAYAVPVGMAGKLAYDWFYLRPTPLEFPDYAILVDLSVCLGIAVLLGELAAHAARRARASERARGEIADEQAALRRVATLVATGAPAHELFTAVAAEAGTLLDVHGIRIARYEDETELVHVAEWNKPGCAPPAYDRAELKGVPADVLRMGRAARIDNYEDIAVRAPFARIVQLKSVVGAPVVVEGRRWGVMIAWSVSGPLPGDTEGRLAGFTELVATAIANAEAQAALTDSRARIVAAADTARRRIERDLHDGAQQRLVSLALHLRGSVQQAVPPGADRLTAELDRVAAELGEVLDELREIARGLHPAALAEGGLRPALKTLARRSAVPVRLDVRVDGRLLEPIELAAYYAVSEALTNTAKHADASGVNVQVETEDGVLHVGVCDNGRGGAKAGGGSGLIGLKDRVEALGGRLTVHSPPGGGTTLHVSLPLATPHVTESAVGVPGRPDETGRGPAADLQVPAREFDDGDYRLG
jgi:signal transduction histidine kinase